MDTAIQMFKFENEQEIRVVQGDDGEPWFVAKDVCACLGILNNSDAIARLDADEKGVAHVDTPGGPQTMATINESGLYSLIVRSDKPEARRFRKWITSEVMPSIRKTGSYMITPPSIADVIMMMAQGFVDHEGRIARLEAVQETAQATLLELPPPTTAAPEKSLRAALNEKSGPTPRKPASPSPTCGASFIAN